MKKIFTTITTVLSLTTLFAQPVLSSDSLHTGLSFNLYSLSNVNTSNLTAYGANVTWDLSTSTSTLIGIADFLPMSSTPYASQYPAANFAIKFTVNGSVSYSLFKLTATALEEVGNNVSTTGGVPFLNFRTALVFPYTFNLSNTDTYQKSGQGTKTIIHKYDAYGTFIASSGTFHNVMRDLTIDNGDTSVNLWSSSPCIPIFQANNNGFTLWKLTSSTTGISEVTYNRIFDMYPNPANDELNIINKELISKIDIINISGKLQFSTVQNKIDISELSQGIYFVKVYSENGVATQKFIKE